MYSKVIDIVTSDDDDGMDKLLSDRGPKSTARNPTLTHRSL
jgi:hypothetical protein